MSNFDHPTLKPKIFGQARPAFGGTPVLEIPRLDPF